MSEEQKSAVDVLKRARELLANGWKQGWFAYDAGGQETSSFSRDAVCFCCHGAIDRAVFEIARGRNDYSVWPIEATATSLLMKAIHRNVGSTFEPCIADWNDAPERTQDEVLAAFDEAIEIAEKSA